MTYPAAEAAWMQTNKSSVTEYVSEHNLRRSCFSWLRGLNRILAINLANQTNGTAVENVSRESLINPQEPIARRPTP